MKLSNPGETEFSKTILVYDNLWLGHIPTYHKIICKTLINNGFKVISASPNPDDVIQYFKTSKDIKSIENLEMRDVNLHSYPSSGLENKNEKVGNSSNKVVSSLSLKLQLVSLLSKFSFFHSFFQTIENWKSLNDKIKKELPNKNIIVFIPYLDLGWLHSLISASYISKKISYKWCGIYLHPTFLRKNKNLNKLNIFKKSNIFKADNCIGFYILDENLKKELNQLTHSKATLFPDITNIQYDGSYSSPILDQIMEKKQNNKIVLLAGVINKKKNVFTFLDAAREAERKNDPFTFVLAGHVDQYTWESEIDRKKFEAILVEPPKNLIVYLDSLKDGNEYNSFVYNSDFIFASYLNFYHSSNSLTKAAYFKKPVIVSEKNLMAERVVKYNLGEVISPESTPDLLKAIRSLSKKTDAQPEAFDFEDYFKSHSESNLKKSLLELLKK